MNWYMLKLKADSGDTHFSPSTWEAAAGRPISVHFRVTVRPHHKKKQSMKSQTSKMLIKALEKTDKEQVASWGVFP